MAKLIALNAEGAGVPFRVLGTVGSDRLKFGATVDVAVAELNNAFEGWFPGFMSGEAAVDN
jgi:phosphoribosylformylglycinamidine synthase